MGIVGQIMSWPSARLPQDWLACDGAEYAVTTAPQLWEVIGQTYGSGGRSFGSLPNLTDRRALGAGQGEDLPDYPLGSSGDDCTAGSGGIGVLGLHSAILSVGTMPSDVRPGLLGTILAFGGSEPPKGYALCQGQLLEISEHSGLFSIIGTQYGGDGRVTFGLPDLRGRAPMGADEAHPPGSSGTDRSVTGSYGHQAINYVMSITPPNLPGGSDVEPIMAEIVQTGANFAPRGWSLCHGQLLPIEEYQALYSLIGVQFGGDGRSTFALPDLRGRIVFGLDTGEQQSLTTGGDGPVGYLAIESMIALEGTYPQY